jgi:hypothetical protein
MRRTSLRSYILRRVLTSTVVKYCGHGSNRTKGRACGGCYGGWRCAGERIRPFMPAAGVTRSGGVRQCGVPPFAPAAGVRGVEMCGGAVYVPSCLRRALRGAEVCGTCGGRYGGGGVRQCGVPPFTPEVGVMRGGGVRQCGVRPFTPEVGVMRSGGVRNYGARPFAPAAGVRGAEVCGNAAYVSSRLRRAL